MADAALPERSDAKLGEIYEAFKGVPLEGSPEVMRILLEAIKKISEEIRSGRIERPQKNPQDGEIEAVPPTTNKFKNEEKLRFGGTAEDQRKIDEGKIEALMIASEAKEKAAEYRPGLVEVDQKTTQDGETEAVSPNINMNVSEDKVNLRGTAKDRREIEEGKELEEQNYEVKQTSPGRRVKDITRKRGKKTAEKLGKEKQPCLEAPRQPGGSRYQQLGFVLQDLYPLFPEMNKDYKHRKIF